MLSSLASLLSLLESLLLLLASLLWLLASLLLLLASLWAVAQWGFYNQVTLQWSVCRVKCLVLWKKEFINVVGLSRSSADLLIRKIMDLYIYLENWCCIYFWNYELIRVQFTPRLDLTSHARVILLRQIIIFWCSFNFACWNSIYQLFDFD